MQKKFNLLIGPPKSGKSKFFLDNFPNGIIVSNQDYEQIKLKNPEINPNQYSDNADS